MQVGVQNMPKMMLKAWQNEETCFQKHVSAIVSPVAKLGNTEETCARYECVWKHVSSFCQAFTVITVQAKVAQRADNSHPTDKSLSSYSKN